MELRRRLAVLQRYSLGLTELYPELLWAAQPDTVRFCQIMGSIADTALEIKVAAEQVHEHARLLFDLSFNEGERRGVHSSPS